MIAGKSMSFRRNFINHIHLLKTLTQSSFAKIFGYLTHNYSICTMRMTAGNHLML